MKHDKPKILLIIPNLGRGGAQRVFHQQRAELSLFADVYGCVFNWSGSFSDDRLATIYSLDVPEGNSLFQKARNFLVRVRRLKRLKLELGVDISISHLEGADYVNLLSRSADRVIFWVHGTKKFDRNIRGILGFIRKEILMPLTYRRADYIVTVSNGIRRELQADLKVSDQRITAIYNRLDLRTITSRAADALPENHQKIFAGPPVIIAHCRLAVQKNLHALLHVYRKLKERTAVRLVLLGDGEEREALLSTCKKLNLETYSVWQTPEVNGSHDVYFLGYISEPYEWLRRATLYVMSSDWEGFPLAICEAMACGLPVVSTDCFTGPKEILAPAIADLDKMVERPVAGEFGMLMPLVRREDPQDLELWASTIDELLGNRILREKYSKNGLVRLSQMTAQSSPDKLREIIQLFLG